MTRRILVCDDAMFTRGMLGGIFAGAGYDVVGEAESGVEAVAQYKRLRPDVVTMDIVMPGLGGIDAVREILAFDPDARIIMCSAMNQSKLVQQALDAGAKELIVKPFVTADVLAAIERVLS